MEILKFLYYILAIIFLGSLLIFGFVDIFGNVISETFIGFKADMISLSNKYPVIWHISLSIICIVLIIIGLKLLFAAHRP